jgi:RNA polymerase sporulation-specific sigma factor
MVMLCRQPSSSFVPSDEELVRRARRGNSRATEQLLIKYRGLVESKARAYFLLGADHDDVVQEGMIGLFKAIRDFRDDRLARFRAFADLCVTRQIVTAVKNATRQKHFPLNGYISLYGTLHCDPESDLTLIECLPDSKEGEPLACLFDKFDERRHLDAVRDTLSALETQVLERYLEGKSYREMSIELQCQPKAVDNALQRIKRKISDTPAPE